MRRLLIIFVLLLAPVAFADSGEKRILLTPDGTLFSVESLGVTTELQETVASSQYLRLIVQQGDKIRTELVPASIKGGMHLSPSLAWDQESKTLFLFWQRMPNWMSSELLICSYRDGVWGETTSIDNAPFRFRFNLRIGVTRVLAATDPETLKAVSKPFLAVHAIWWDQSGYGETAEYALLAIENGKARSIHTGSLLDFVGANATLTPAELPADYDREIFRHPAIFELPGGGSVEVVFADWDRNRMQRVTVGVEEHGTLRLPIGVWGGETKPPGKHSQDVAGSEEITMVRGVGNGHLAFCFRGTKTLRYMMLNDGEWSALTSIALSERVNAEAGIDAIRGLLTSR